MLESTRLSLVMRFAQVVCLENILQQSVQYRMSVKSVLSIRTHFLPVQGKRVVPVTLVRLESMAKTVCNVQPVNSVNWVLLGIIGSS